MVGFGPATTGMRSIENLTSSAVKSEPSWNLTPGRSLNSQTVGSSVFQLRARRGSIWSLSPDQVSVSKTCFNASAWVPVAVKCGSIDSGPARTPMVSVCASAPVETVAPSRAAKAARRKLFTIVMTVSPVFVWL